MASSAPSTAWLASMRTTSVSVRELPTPRPTEAEPEGELRGVLPRQGLEKAVDEGWVVVDEHLRVPPSNIQTASIDLRLGDYAWSLRCSFLPDARSTVEEKIADVALDRIWIR